MTTTKKTSPWAWIGCGCAAVVVLGLGGCGTVAYIGWRSLNQFEADLTDPEVRQRRVSELLGSQELPEGYYPLGRLSIPYLFDAALLTDRDPETVSGDPEAFGERGFIYLSMRGSQRRRRQLDDFFEGRTDDPADLPWQGAGSTWNLEMQGGEVVARGSLRQGDMDLRYVSLDNDMWVETQHIEAITTLILVECPQSTRIHLGVWFQKIPRRETAATTVDETAVGRFMGHFAPCGV